MITFYWAGYYFSAFYTGCFISVFYIRIWFCIIRTASRTLLPLMYSEALLICIERLYIHI